MTKKQKYDDVAALAIGAVPFEEAAELGGRLATDPELRAAYRGFLEAAGVLGHAVESTASELSKDRKERLKSRILSAAREARRELNPKGSDFATVIPPGQLVQFGEGIRWAVLAGPGRTTVYWVFDPPACGDFPLETHTQAQSGLVLEGAFTLLFAEGRALPLKAGDQYSIAPGTVHGATFEARTLLCEVYTPNYEDLEALYRSHVVRRG